VREVRTGLVIQSRGVQFWYGARGGLTIELRHDRFLALGDTDGIVKDSGLRIVRVRFLGGFQLVQVEHLVNDLLLIGVRLACCEGRHVSGCDWK